MGRRNRERRAAKARARRRSRPQPERRDSSATADEPPSREAPVDIRELLNAATAAAIRGRPDIAGVFIERLAEIDAHEVAAEAEWALLMNIERLWAGGWQPAELEREMRRTGTTAGARLGRLLIDASHQAYDPDELDPRWTAQLDALGMTRTTPRSGWVARWCRAESLDALGLVTEAVGLLRVLGRLPRLEVLLPPPGSRGEFQDLAGSTVDDPVLDKVRALLAQAESTPYEGEAESFTAKAHELMARHAIDAARLAASAGEADERPATMRMPVDDPYADIKSLLLQTVAEHGRCRAVWSSAVALSTVVGFASDVAAVELLFTSLLVQAQSAMVAAAKTAPPGARTRSRRYRSSFLQAYAVRIGDRLGEISATVRADAEAEHGAALVSVLERRARVVDDVIEARFPDVVTRGVRGGYDALGWATGCQAADLAKLNAAELQG